jgi:DNA-binding LacI/PurR family transcriptional regulator
MQGSIIGPADMTSTTYAVELPEELRSNTASAHGHWGQPVVGKWLNAPYMGAGAAWTTPTDLASVYYGAFTQASGYELANQVLAQNPRPTAIFGANNFLSIGILKALRDANLSVPQDIAVVGFDDLPVSLIVDPILTVVAQPAYEMGQQATKLLLQRLSGNASESSQEIVLPTELIVRQSSGPPRMEF